MSIKKGDFIRLSFTGKLEDEKIFDTTDEQLAKKNGIFDKDRTYSPMTVIVGSGFLVEGLEEALIGKNAGYEGTITVPPEKGYGERSLDAIEIVPSKKFDGDIEPGEMVEYNGRVGFVESVSGGRVKVDYNEPLAGKRLIYSYRIEEVIEGKGEKIQALLKGYVDENASFSIHDGTIEVDVPKRLALDESWSIGKLLIARFLISSAELSKVVFRETFTKDDLIDESGEE